MKPPSTPPPGAVPPHYRERLYWQITQSSWRLTVVNLISLPAAGLFGVFFFGWAAQLNRMPKTLELKGLQILWVLLAVVLTLALHELAHGLAMRAFGARPKFGVLWQGLMLYATAPGYAFRRNQYIGVILAPLVGLSLVALLGIVFASPPLAALLAVCATLNGAGAVGDLWILLITIRYPPEAYVMDERDGMRVFMPPA